MNRSVNKEIEISSQNIKEKPNNHVENLTPNERFNIIVWQIIAFIGLNLVYILVITEVFDYYDFQFEFDLYKFILGNFIILFAILLGAFIIKGYFAAVYNIMLIYLLGGQVVFYQFNSDANIVHSVIILFSLLFIFLFSRINKKFKAPRKIENSETIIGLSSFLLFLPFFYKYYNHINIRNLLFIDVYETREHFTELKNIYTGYVMAPLSRIILPYLIIKKILNKKYLMTLIYILMLLFLYLSGALKSIFLGLIALIFFYRGTYYKKTILFLKTISLMFFSGIFLYVFFNNIFLLDAFGRRVFFVPARLGNIFYDFFKDNLTYLSHSPLGLGLVEYPYDLGPARFIGQVVIGSSGLSANTGIYIEGLISFGIVGGVIGALIVSLILLYFYLINISPRYFGLIFVYVYYMNTAFFSTLLISHGLLFLMVFSYLFLRRENIDGKS